MEANQSNRDLKSSDTGYSPGRDTGRVSTGDYASDSGVGREVERGRFAKEPIEATKDAAKGAAREGARAAREIGHEIKQQASGVVQELKGSAQELIKKNKGRAGGQAHAVANSLHRMAQDLEQDSQARPLGRIAEAIASSVDSAGEWLENKEPRQIIRQVEDFARREPVLFLGGALLVGLVASRFLKASATHADSGRSFEGSRRPDSEGHFGSSAPMNDREPRGPLDNTGLGMPSATPVDVTRPVESRPDIRRDIPPDMGAGVKGGV